MVYERKTAADGTPYVTVTQEATVNVHLLRANLAKFRADEAAARARAEETEAMIAAVIDVAPDLMAAVDMMNAARLT